MKNSRSLHRTFNVEPLYLQHENTGLAIDYMVIIKMIIIIIIINYMVISMIIQMIIIIRK